MRRVVFYSVFFAILLLSFQDAYSRPVKGNFNGKRNTFTITKPFGNISVNMYGYVGEYDPSTNYGVIQIDVDTNNDGVVDGTVTGSFCYDGNGTMIFGSLWQYRPKGSQRVSTNDMSDNIVSLYPNPVSDFLICKAETYIRSVFIIDISSSLVKTVDLINQKEVRVELSGLSSGSYFAIIDTDEGRISIPFVVTK